MATPFPDEVALSRRFTADRSWTAALRWVAAAAGLVVLLGMFFAPDRTWPNVLIAAMYLVGLSLAGMLFLAFHYLPNAGWSVAVKRVAEALASTLPLAAVLVLVTLAGTNVLYEWAHPEAVANSTLLQGKSAWLNVPFFAARAVLYLAVWSIFCWAMLRTSRRQDKTGGLAANRVPRILALRTKNVRAAYAELSRQGVEFIATPRDPDPVTGVESVVCCRDPDGLVVELIEYMGDRLGSRIDDLETRS